MADAGVVGLIPKAITVEQDECTQNDGGLGDHCVIDRPAPLGTEPSGDISQIEDVDVYISKPNEYPHQPSRLLLYLTGGTGLLSKNNQLQADKFASHGFVVVMPDMFDKDYAPNSLTTVEDMNLTMIEQIKLRAADVAKSFMLDMWLARHSSEKVLPILYKVIEGMKQEFADALANGNGIYCVGYCLGAKYCLQLAGERVAFVPGSQKLADEENGTVKNGPHIKVGAIAHGTLVTREDFEGIQSPMFLVCVEDDQLFSQDILDDGEKYMKEKSIQYEVEIFPKVPHGFAVIGEYEDSKIKMAQEQAFDLMLSWLNAH